MKMYTLADHAIKPEEFSRAATICSGKVLSPYVVKTVYQVGIPPNRYVRYSFGIGIGQYNGIISANILVSADISVLLIRKMSYHFLYQYWPIQIFLSVFNQ